MLPASSGGTLNMEAGFGGRFHYEGGFWGQVYIWRQLLDARVLLGLY
jgi:hypothetical protein